jgi:plastocyanin
MVSGASAEPSGYTAGAKTTYGFGPDVVTVVIGKNNTVYWVNDDVADHTATSDTAGIFDSGVLSPGGSYQFTFTTPGTYSYHCSLHPWMQGTVIVKSS